MWPDEMELMAGKFSFGKPQMEAYRQAVDDPSKGAALENALAMLMAGGEYEPQGQSYKRVLRGYDTDHPRADLLRYSGLWVHPLTSPSNLTSPTLVDEAIAHFERMAPVYLWLRDTLA